MDTTSKRIKEHFKRERASKGTLVPATRATQKEERVVGGKKESNLKDVERILTRVWRV